MNQQPTDPMVPVLIVGGGVVGLSAALFLLNQGIRPLLIERHRGTSIHPRARGFDIRTMELYREIQVGEAIREAGKALAPSWGIHTSDSMAAALRRKKPGERKSPEKALGAEGLASLSPETGARCTQDLSEPVLLAAARERGADVRYFTELLSFTQNEQEVEARVLDRDTGEEQVIRARYLIAADGARSQTREALGAATVGKGALSDLLNIYFEADLEDFVRGREFSILLIRRPTLRGMLASINNRDRWVFHLYYDKAAGEVAADFTTERITGFLREVIGLPDIAIRVISILPWQPTIKVVKEMQFGRIFLAGDAAHIMTPYGGKGANTGIQDAHNLAWKLAAVIKGEAHPSLLLTYSIERQPIGLFNALRSGEWADRYGLLTKKLPMMLGLVGSVLSARLATMMGMRKLGLRIMLRSVAGTIGLPDYTYTSAAIIHDGTRVPHCWVSYRGQRISTLDLLGRGWVLLTGKDNRDWVNASTEMITRLGFVIPVYPFGPFADLDYKENKIEDIFEIGDRGAVLIRPDGFVAWKSKGPADQPAALLENLMRKLSGFV